MKKKCQVIMLATEKTPNKNQLRFDYNGLGLETNNVTRIQGATTQHLYITSSDEIKEDGWYINSWDNSKNPMLCKINSKKEADDCNIFKHCCKKIIATTDPELIKNGVAQIEFSFIDNYITEYNKGNIIKEINVDYEQSKIYIEPQNYQQYLLKPKKLQFSCTTNVNNIWTLKLRSDNTIIINRLQKVFTKEDMEKAFITGFYKGMTPEVECEFKTWFKQNY